MIKKIIMSTDDIKDLIIEASKKWNDFKNAPNGPVSPNELYLPLTNKYYPWVSYKNGVIYIASPIEDFEEVRNITSSNNHLERE